MYIVRFVVGLLFITASVRAISQVLFDSDPGDYIGGGKKVTYTSGITVSTSRGRVEVKISDESNWLTLEFEVPNYVNTFAVGNYGYAERAPFRSPVRPGLEINGNGRGCNTLTGWFRVLEAQFDNQGSLEHLAIDFKQNCGGGSAALYGGVRINSSLPININGPFAVAEPAKEAIEGATVSLNGGQSFKRDNSSLSFKWTQQAGPHVNLEGSTSATPRFTAPTDLPLGGAVLVFRLQVTTALNDADADTLQVKVNSKSDRQNYIDFNSQSGDYIGGGIKHHFDKSNTAFKFIGSQSGAYFTLSSSDSWNIEMVPASGSKFNVGYYEVAERHPFQSTGSPGLSVNGDGRGCNRLTGRFNVTQIQMDSSNNIIAFGADFEQHCEGSTPALFGTIRYNYLDPNVPTASAGALQIVSPGQTVMLDGSRSTDPMGNSISHEWSQTNGPNVLLSNYSSPIPTFVAPAVTSSHILGFSLLVKNNLGYISSAITQVTINPV